MQPDFWKFWIGQTISNFGSSFTAFAWPLLVYKLTGSALNLAFSSVSTTLPWLLFGFFLGAYVDRSNRKQLMTLTDFANALVIASIPLLAWLHQLVIWQIYLVGFLGSTLSICFLLAQSAALPSLVTREQLATANGRIQAATSAARVLGPLIAGAIVAIMPLSALLFFDALSFLLSAGLLLLIRTSFNSTTQRKATSFRSDMREGLSYVLQQPVIRSIAIIAALFNLVGITLGAQLVVFARQHLLASDTQIGFLFSAGSLGVIVCSLLAGTMRKYWSFGAIALGTTMINGLLILVLAMIPWYWLALPLWALSSGMIILFNITVVSLRQALVPNHLLGRVAGVINVIGQAISPLGTVLGGWLIVLTNQVAWVYGAIGVIICGIAVGFSFTALAHAERYLPSEE
ncbi:MFS transporter [Dictyobacter formicarum]|uniref:MFS transporter n=1 Tax=Dictyobacter formicarum TaxID=2778368 RepID=A0ABQ3VI55_9CHLR|nr:MFS transporter [Dictyobacter formicarum]GHO85053.1 hypothetical protein KSZ_30590 [Dictyobacter formicarum]